MAESKLERYLAAATRPNTARSYAGAVRHFEVEWGGCLPASAETLARYVAHFAETLTVSTLRQRLAALGTWHRDHGFVDPTSSALIRQMLRGIRTVHPHVERRATPLQLKALGRVTDWLEAAIAAARARDDFAAELRAVRDRAFLLLGFWKGFRSDELIGLQAEHVTFVGTEGMLCHVTRSKTDREANGKQHRVPGLTRWCPVEATRAWLARANIAEGPVFRSISSAGKLGSKPLHPNSVVRLMRGIFARAGLEEADEYSSHSLRRGFAGWANANRWDLHSLMAYVGWRDPRSAMRYVDVLDPFMLSTNEGSAEPQIVRATPAATPSLALLPRTLELRLMLETDEKRARSKVLRDIEESLLARHAALRLDKAGTRFRLAVMPENGLSLDDQIANLIDALHRTALNHHISAEVALVDPATGECWD